LLGTYTFLLGKRIDFMEKKIILIAIIVVVIAAVFFLYQISIMPEPIPSYETTTSSQTPLFNNVPTSGETPPVPPS
jgi:hypothetical protein